MMLNLVDCTSSNCSVTMERMKVHILYLLRNQDVALVFEEYLGFSAKCQDDAGEVEGPTFRLARVNLPSSDAGKSTRHEEVSGKSDMLTQEGPCWNELWRN